MSQKTYMAGITDVQIDTNGAGKPVITSLTVDILQEDLHDQQFTQKQLMERLAIRKQHDERKQSSDSSNEEIDIFVDESSRVTA